MLFKRLLMTLAEREEAVNLFRKLKGRLNDSNISEASGYYQSVNNFIDKSLERIFSSDQGNEPLIISDLNDLVESEIKVIKILEECQNDQ